MAIWSAQGGHILLDDAEIPVAETRINGMARLTDATTSAGVQRATVLREGQGSFSLPWDDTTDPKSILELREGSEAVAYGLRLGNSGFAISDMPIIVESVEYVVNSVNDVVRVNVNFFVQGAVPDPVSIG
jgi:hypothetical protein